MGYINFRIFGIIAVLLVLSVAGCGRGRPSQNPPIHLNPNMDNQEKYKSQAKSKFFADGSSMRQPVPGTIPRGFLRDDDVYYLGIESDGGFVKNAPVKIDMLLLKRGRERFDIYCSPCHSRIGDGRGIMVSRGYLPPPTFHSDRIRNMADGEIFNVITHGVRNMPAYSHQISVNDRWAIIRYLRALERSQNARIEDVPEELREKVQAKQ